MANRQGTRRDALLAQQAVLAEFGEFALRADELDPILNEACRLVARALGTDFAKIMQRQADGRTLLVRAGVGWRPGVVGRLTLDAGDGSPRRASPKAAGKRRSSAAGIARGPAHGGPGRPPGPWRGIPDASTLPTATLRRASRRTQSP